jgi:hypothetical protein
MARQEEAANEDGEQGAAKKRKTNDGKAAAKGEGQTAEEKSTKVKTEEETAEESEKTKTTEEPKAKEEKKEATIEGGFWGTIPPSRAFLGTVSVDKNDVEVSNLFHACKLEIYDHEAHFSRNLCNT